MVEVGWWMLGIEGKQQLNAMLLVSDYKARVPG